MVLGLGTGSTVKHAVDRIGELLRQGKLENIVGIPTSKKTHEQAVSVGIPLSDLDAHPVIDLAIDGADEVDHFLNLVKGRGGSLLREKMIESVCRKFIVDESKLVMWAVAGWVLGFQPQYAVSELSEKNIWKMFDAGLYDECRRKYGAVGSFLSLYYKCNKGKKTEKEVQEAEQAHFEKAYAEVDQPED